MIVYKYVSPKNMTLLIQKCPFKNEITDLSKYNFFGKIILKAAHFKSNKNRSKNINILLTIQFRRNFETFCFKFYIKKNGIKNHKSNYIDVIQNLKPTTFVLTSTSKSFL